ncbi:MAG TPA: efflux RND transporter periplasmic adaptor subunit [Terriglobales bacterium]|nr:efflux RND transporter periplasmic adaptor subunit [Terriglobales bacterium]
MPIQPAPVTTEPNETEAVRPDDYQPSDVGPNPAGRAKLLIGAVLLVLITAGAVTFLNRKSETDALAKETEAVSVPTVAVVQPQAEPGNDELVLPGNLQAFIESPIFARTNGYLLRWYKDMGSKVEKGELLAAIDTPEVDQELSQARASREQIKAALGLAKISTDRWANLLKSDSVSQQEADQQASGYQQALANLAAADANVRRLEELESFKNVYAPFSGVLTRRNVDPGALINSGAQAAGRELFDIARVDPLRVYVSVPQAYAPNIKAGMKANVTLQEFPGQKFLGTVVRTAEAIDLATRTLNTEVDVPNKDGKLLPGSFGKVHFATGTSVPRITIPVNAMLFRAEGPQVAVVDKDGKVHLRPISIGRDFGATLEILGGLDVSDQIVINPSDSLEEGQKVHVAKPSAGDGRS